MIALKFACGSGLAEYKLYSHLALLVAGVLLVAMRRLISPRARACEASGTRRRTCIRPDFVATSTVVTQSHSTGWLSYPSFWNLSLGAWRLIALRGATPNAACIRARASSRPPVPSAISSRIGRVSRGTDTRPVWIESAARTAGGAAVFGRRIRRRLCATAPLGLPNLLRGARGTGYGCFCGYYRFALADRNAMSSPTELFTLFLSALLVLRNERRFGFPFPRESAADLSRGAPSIAEM